MYATLGPQAKKRRVRQSGTSSSSPCSQARSTTPYASPPTAAATAAQAGADPTGGVLPCRIFWSHQKACNEHATCELRVLEREIARRQPQPARTQGAAAVVRSDAWVTDRTANGRGIDSDELIPPDATQVTTGGWERESVAAEVTDQDIDLALFLPPPSVETQSRQLKVSLSQDPFWRDHSSFTNGDSSIPSDYTVPHKKARRADTRRPVSSYQPMLLPELALCLPSLSVECCAGGGGTQEVADPSAPSSFDATSPYAYSDDIPDSSLSPLSFGRRFQTPELKFTSRPISFGLADGAERRVKKVRLDERTSGHSTNISPALPPSEQVIIPCTPGAGDAGPAKGSRTVASADNKVPPAGSLTGLNRDAVVMIPHSRDAMVDGDKQRVQEDQSGPTERARSVHGDTLTPTRSEQGSVETSRESTPFDVTTLNALKHILQTIRMPDQVELLEKLEAAYITSCLQRGRVEAELKGLKATLRRLGGGTR